MEKTVASSNRASSRSNFMKRSVTDPVEGIGLVCSVVIFNTLCFICDLSPKGRVIGITQNMNFVSGTQLFNRNIVEFVDYDDAMKHVGNYEGVIKTTSSTNIDGDRKFDFLCRLACSTGKITKKINHM